VHTKIGALHDPAPRGERGLRAHLPMQLISRPTKSSARNSVRTRSSGPIGSLVGRPRLHEEIVFEKSLVSMVKHDINDL